MFLGLLVVAMAIGFVAAGAWVYIGGSIILAIVIYSLVATFFTLGTSVLSFVIAERTAARASGRVESLQPAE